MLKRGTTFLFMVVFIASLIWSCGGQKPASDDADKARSDSDSVQTRDGAQKPGINKNESEELVPVEVTTVSIGDISNYILLSSNLETEVMADVYSHVQGIVDEISKEEGQYVKKNEVLLSLEAREYELAESKARIQYQEQLNNYNRLKAMYEKNLLSVEEFERAKFSLEAAQVAWDEAKLNVEYTKVKSPIAGRIGERLAKIGERIQPTDKLFSVVDNSQVIAVVYVPEKNLNQLKIGQRAFVTSDHLKGKEFKAWIKRISPVVDPSSGTFKVTVGVRNAGNALRPGMFVNVHIIIDTHENVVLIPKTAVVYENEYMNVYVVRDSLAHKIRLQAGYEDNEKVEAVSDIEENDKIIVVGQAGMKDKTKVRVVSEREIQLGS